MNFFDVFFESSLLGRIAFQYPGLQIFFQDNESQNLHYLLHVSSVNIISKKKQKNAKIVTFYEAVYDSIKYKLFDRWHTDIYYFCSRVVP